jgi:holo-[acyl-carrier protein] synthase
MIHGTGIDIVAIARFKGLLDRHGEACLYKLLAPGEHAECLSQSDLARFLAKRFAAKEALGKALGCGLRAPVLLTSIALSHDAQGKPIFRYGTALALWLRERGLIAHLSLSDEHDYAVASVVVERVDDPPPAPVPEGNP